MSHPSTHQRPLSTYQRPPGYHRSASTAHRYPPAHQHQSTLASNDNPPIPRTRPQTTICLPPDTISAYQRLLSLLPSSPILHTTLSTFPPPLLKKPYRKSFLPSFLFQTPIFKFFLERSRAKLAPEECCELCPLHERLLEAPLVHLMGLIAYEMYTHLQSLSALHPAQRNQMTNGVLEKLYPWQERKFFRPGSVVEGCLACELGRLYQDFPAMEALSVVAKSGRRQGCTVQLVDEGWLGWWADGRRGVREVRADRRIVRTRGDNAEWRGDTNSRKARGILEWREKRGFVLDDGLTRPTRSSPSQRQSVRMEKLARAEAPMRPDRPEGLTLFSKEEDRGGNWILRERDRNPKLAQEIKRKPVPSAKTGANDRGKKTISTATTMVGSPHSPHPGLKRHSYQIPARAPSVRSHSNQPQIHEPRAPVNFHPPASSVYSHTQGFGPEHQPTDFRRTQSTIKPPSRPTSTLPGRQQQARLPSTQQTRWSDFQASKPPAPSSSHRRSPSQTQQRRQPATSPPRRTKTTSTLASKVAAGEYEWWAESDFSEDEKIVVPSLSLPSRHGPDSNRTSRKEHHNNSSNNSNSNHDDGDDDSGSEYERDDEDEEEIHQRYLDEHEALLRMARGEVEDEWRRPGTRDYLNTLPERHLGGSTVGGMDGRIGVERRERLVRR